MMAPKACKARPAQQELREQRAPPEALVAPVRLDLLGRLQLLPGLLDPREPPVQLAPLGRLALKEPKVQPDPKACKAFKAIKVMLVPPGLLVALAQQAALVRPGLLARPGTLGRPAQMAQPARPELLAQPVMPVPLDPLAQMAQQALLDLPDPPVLKALKAQLVLKVYRVSRAYKAILDLPGLLVPADQLAQLGLPAPHRLLLDQQAPLAMLAQLARLAPQEPPGHLGLPDLRERLEAPAQPDLLAAKAMKAPLARRVCRVSKARLVIMARLDLPVLLALPDPQDRPALLAPQAPQARLVLVDPPAPQALPAQAAPLVRRVCKVFKATPGRLVRQARLALLAQPVLRAPLPRLPDRLVRPEQLEPVVLPVLPEPPESPGLLDPRVRRALVVPQAQREPLEQAVPLARLERWSTPAPVLPTPRGLPGERHTPPAAPALWLPWQLAHL